MWIWGIVWLIVCLPLGAFLSGQLAKSHRDYEATKGSGYWFK